MKQLTLPFSLLVCSLALTACGGSGQQDSIPKSASAPEAVPNGYVVPQFVITIPNAQSQTKSLGMSVKPQYVSASTLSVNITLNTVNGAAPPSGLTTSVTTNISSGSCNLGCTVSGPAVPPGTDTFTITTYSANNAAGSPLSTQTQSFTVTAGIANLLSITLIGVPSTFTIAGVPSATAGAAFSSASTLTLAVKDAAGNTISGTYANPVTFSTSDTSSLTRASSLSVNGGSAASSVTIHASTDTLKLNYGGQAIAASTLSASATGATTKTAAFAPTLSPIVPSPSTVDLYATSGTGSSGTVTVTEPGWSGSPYNQIFTVSVPSNCSNIATMTGNITSTTGTTFSTTVAGSPSVGSCTTTLTDGAGQSHGVTLTYTTTGIIVNAKHRR